MDKKKKILILALAFVVLIGGAYLLYAKLGKTNSPDLLAEQNSQNNNDSNSAEDRDKVLAPDFTVYDKNGDEVKLSDYNGKPIVINFWASWCGPCKMEMPDFQEKYTELKDSINFLMVNMTDGSRETVKSASEFIEEQGYDFPVFYDTESDAAITYGATALPTTFFIDAEGYAVAQASGAIDGDTLQRGIDMITKQ